MFSFLRRIYDWVIRASNSRWAFAVLVFVALTEPVFFPIPPEVVLMTMSFSRPKRALFYTAVSSLFTLLGGVISYLIGKFFWDATQDFFFKYVFSQELFKKASEVYDKNAFIAIFTIGFTPLPDKVFLISAGIFSVNFPVFLISYGLSRAIRYLIVAVPIFFFGDRVRGFIERHFNTVTMALGILLVIVFLFVRYFIANVISR